MKLRGRKGKRERDRQTKKKVYIGCLLNHLNGENRFQEEND